MSSWYAMALTITVSMLMATPSFAQTRVAVHDFYGPGGSTLRVDVANLLERQEGVVVVPRQEVQDAAQRIGVDSFSPEGRKAIARELLISAWLTGVVKKRHHRLSMNIVVYDGAEHQRVGDAHMSARDEKHLRSAVQRALWDKTREAVMVAVAPLPPGRGPLEEQKAEEESLASKKVVAVSTSMRVAAAQHDDSSLPPPMRKRTPDALRASVGFGSPYRTLSYSDPITTSLGDYRLGGAPMIDLALAYYPGRHFTDGWASWLGIDTAVQVAFGAATEDRDGRKYESRYDSYRVGLRGRIPVGKHAVSAFSGFAMSRFVVKPESKDTPTLTPAADYRTVRSGLGAEFALSETLTMGTDIAYLYMLSAGQVSDWFPRASANGLELSLHASYALTQHLYARVSAAYQRTAFDFNSRPGDERAAGGATDQALTMAVGAGVNL